MVAAAESAVAIADMAAGVVAAGRLVPSLVVLVADYHTPACPAAASVKGMATRCVEVGNPDIVAVVDG